MSDRFHSLTAALSDDMREEEIEALRSAIMLLKGVCAVSAHVANPDSYMAEARARREYGQKLWDVLYPPKS